MILDRLLTFLVAFCIIVSKLSFSQRFFSPWLFIPNPSSGLSPGIITTRCLAVVGSGVGK